MQIAKAKKSLLGVLLCFALFASTTPIRPALSQEQQQPQEQQLTSEETAALEAAFEAEFLDYQATHTDAELTAYAQERLTQMTLEAIDSAGSMQSNLEGDPTEFPIEWEPGPGPGTGGTGGGDDRWWRLNSCLENRRRECVSLYHADLATAVATTTAVVAGCAALAVGPALAVCLAAAAAHHAAMIAAAQFRYNACITRGRNDCMLENSRP